MRAVAGSRPDAIALVGEHGLALLQRVVAARGTDVMLRR